MPVEDDDNLCRFDAAGRASSVIGASTVPTEEIEIVDCALPLKIDSVVDPSANDSYAQRDEYRLCRCTPSGSSDLDELVVQLDVLVG